MLLQLNNDCEEVAYVVGIQRLKQLKNISDCASLPILHCTNLMSLGHVALPACAVQALKTAQRGHKTEHTHTICVTNLLSASRKQ